MAESAVTFATPTRIHIGVAVQSVERSLPFYRALFGQEPTKLRAGYAKFEVADPPVNFTLNEATVGRGHVGPQHFGVQVQERDAIGRARARFDAAAVATRDELETRCCFAQQDKLWATDPDGHRWEVFLVTVADVPEPRDASRCSPVAPVEPAADAWKCCPPGACR